MSRELAWIHQQEAFMIGSGLTTASLCAREAFCSGATLSTFFFLNKQYQTLHVLPVGSLDGWGNAWGLPRAPESKHALNPL